MRNRYLLAPALALSLCLAAADSPGSRAETAAGDAAAPATTADKPLTHATEPLESCMAKWDPGTHMTRDTWRQSCLRIRQEREKYVRNR